MSIVECEIYTSITGLKGQEMAVEHCEIERGREKGSVIVQTTSFAGKHFFGQKYLGLSLLVGRCDQDGMVRI